MRQNRIFDGKSIIDAFFDIDVNKDVMTSFFEWVLIV